MAKIYKRKGSPQYYANFKDAAGKRRRVSLKTTNRREANAKLKELTAARTPKPSSKRADFGKTFMGYAVGRFLPAHKARTAASTHKRVSDCVFHTLGPVFGGTLLSEITPPMVEAWLYKRLDTYKHNTVAKEFAILKAILNQALRDEIIPTNRAALALMPKNRDESTRTHLTRDEFQRIIDECTEAYGAVYTLLFNTGMRKGEATALTYDHLVNGSVFLPKSITKTAESRTIPLNDAAKAAIETLRAYSDGEHIIPPKSRSVYFTGIQRAAKRAGFDLEERRIGLHTLRRSFATLLANNPAIPITTTQKLLGHSSLTQTSKYVHESPESMVDAVQTL